MPDLATFSYTPLNGDSGEEMRLVFLLPGDEWSTICCQLRTSALPSDKIDQGDTSSYAALSYVWGHTNHDRSILLEEKPVLVRENLWMALFYLRSKTHVKILWIDALCLNQADTLERNHQVSQMGRIYGSADHVIVWLGLPTEQSYSALRYLQSLVTPELSSLLRTGVHGGSDEDLESVNDICSRPYWRRLWIIQEVIRAVRVSVQCGTATIDWDHLSAGLEILAEEREQSKNSASGLELILGLRRHRKEYHQIGCGLVELLETFSDAECLDPRDKIYGLLGLANDIEDGALLADYGKSASDLFGDVVSFYYRQSLEQEVSGANMNWRSPGLLRFAQLLRQLLFRDDSPNQAEVGFISGRTSELFIFVGVFTGSVAVVGPTLVEVKVTQYSRSALINAWYNIVRPRSKQERGHAYEAMKSGLTCAFDYDERVVRRVVLVDSPVSKALIG
jgi:Heterokaryon incompatibility protein (HET)